MKKYLQLKDTGRRKTLLLMGLNIGLVASSIVSFWITHSVPAILAISCGTVGGVTLYSRVKIWKTGTLRQFYDLVRDDEKAIKKIRNLDSMFWATALFNSGVFLWFMTRHIAEYVQIS